MVDKSRRKELAREYAERKQPNGVYENGVAINGDGALEAAAFTAFHEPG